MLYVNIILEIIFLIVINYLNNKKIIEINDKILWFFNGSFFTLMIYSIVVDIMLANILYEIEYLKFLIEVFC